MMPPPSRPSYLSRPHLQTSPQRGWGFQHMHLEGTQTFRQEQWHDLRCSDSDPPGMLAECSFEEGKTGQSWETWQSSWDMMRVQERQLQGQVMGRGNWRGKGREGRSPGRERERSRKQKTNKQKPQDWSLALSIFWDLPLFSCLIITII